LVGAILSPHLKSATPINREHATDVVVRNYALLFFGCVLFHLAGTWTLPLIDRDEPRFAEASREMIERGDYVVPHFNNQFRLDKPPLAYWTQVASFAVFGQNDFAARFPSTIAAALVALSIFAWGTRIGGSRVGLWAAIIFTLSLQTFLHAKAAVADMWLVLFITVAHWSGYELLRHGLIEGSKRPTPKAFASRQLNSEGFREQAVQLRKRSPAGSSTSNSEGVEAPVVRRAPARGWWLIFYSSLALGFLAKGPIAWTPLLTVGSTIFFAPGLQLGRRFRFGRGSLLTVGIVALWGIPALIRTHGEFFTVGIGRHVIGRSFGAMEGHGANSLGAYLLLLPFYFVTIFVSFFPWSIKFPWLMRNLWRKKQAGITDPSYSGRDGIDNYLLAGAAIIFVIFSIIKTKLPHYTLPAFSLLALLLARHWVQSETALLKAITVTTACLWIAIALIVPPLIAPAFPAYALFQQSRSSLRSEMEFGAVDYQEPSLVWYFRSRVNGFLTPLNKKSAPDFMARAGPRFLILPTALATKIFPNPPSNWASFSTRGFNIVKGGHVDLTLLLKPD
jgi:4-amino-4-deoxy-L-arabinose transferase-like glycosyltransferase